MLDADGNPIPDENGRNQVETRKVPPQAIKEALTESRRRWAELHSAPVRGARAVGACVLGGHEPGCGPGRARSRAGRAVMRRAARELLRRVGGLAMAAVLVASQLLSCLGPVAAYAASGSMTITSSTHGGEGFIAFGTSDGHEAYCINPERDNPDGHTFTRWDWTGEASGILLDPHALAYLMSVVAPGNPQGFATPDSSINLAVWMLCGASVDFGSGSYSAGDMHGNIYEGAGGRVSRSDAAKIRSVVADARAHAGKSGAGDRMSCVWYNDGAACQSVVEVLPYCSVRLGKTSAGTSVSGSNPLYSLAGAEYGVYSDEACRTGSPPSPRTGTATALRRASRREATGCGRPNPPRLRARRRGPSRDGHGGGHGGGRHHLRRPKKPDDVTRGGMSLAKRDLELDGTTPQGDASLDATYTIYNRSVAAVIVGGSSHAPGEAVWSGMANPDDGSISTPADLLPYGTYEVRETAPATGYLPDGQVTVTFELDASGMGGHDLVALEVLSQGEATVATHEGIEDEGQTVHVEEPVTPEIPATPRYLSKTGDDTNLGPFVAAMAVSGIELIALGVSALRRRRPYGRYFGELDDGLPHIRRGRAVQVMPDLDQGEEVSA